MHIAALFYAVLKMKDLVMEVVEVWSGSNNIGWGYGDGNGVGNGVSYKKIR